MDKEIIIKEAEEFMRANIPLSRLTKSGSDKSYLKHVLGVRKYALELAEIYSADKFIVEVSAFLHDIGADAGEKHAFESAKISEKFLSKYDIDIQVKEKIIRCIEKHSMGSRTENIEEQVIQDADGIIFLEDTYKFYFEKQKQKFSSEEAKKLSFEKIQGMFDKIKTEKGKELAKRFFEKSLECI